MRAADFKGFGREMPAQDALALAEDYCPAGVTLTPVYMLTK